MDSNNPYDLIITDMYYPDEPGGREEQSGDVLIDRVIKNKITIPVILCSSVNLKYPEIYGCVYYSRERNWEADMQTLVNSLVQDNINKSQASDQPVIHLHIQA